jgi:hypothetical protein
MTQITDDHVEWAVVDRLRRMLDEPQHELFNVTQAYALFTTTLCWVTQRIRVRADDVNSRDDKVAHELFEKFSDTSIADDPWRVNVKPVRRIEMVGPHRVTVPGPSNFATHTVARFLINLRDASAHGDARNVRPFNVTFGSEPLLVGFCFVCAELNRERRKTWEGRITLLQSDMRRIGGRLAKIYCDRLSNAHASDSHFGSDAGSIKERAA